MPNILNRAEYRDKVLGCWLGKNIGGTAGAPFEWLRQVNNITFYPQTNLRGEAMPNDDLDIQLLWLCAMEEKGIDVTSHRLAEYWVTYVTPHWAEYGTGKTNMRQGLPPPLCGTFKNDYKDSCGSYIRSEIWACVCPGAPWKAAQYAYEDAILDHGNGEGLYAEIFMSALESAAFVLDDLRACIDVGLSFIPADCGVAKAVATTLECFDKKMPWVEMRDEVLRLHRGRLMNWTAVSEPDRKKGFDTGKLGYDVPSNIAFTLGGLLWGGDDFGQVQCICVNLGEDTDCTAATAGSVWGILHGAKKIPQRWIDPIGRGIKTVVLNLGELGYFGDQLPRDVDNLTDRTLALAEKVQRDSWFGVMLGDGETDCHAMPWEAFKSHDNGRDIWRWSKGPRYDFDLGSAHVDYGVEGPVVRPGEPKKIRVVFYKRSRAQLNLSLNWHVPEGWTVAPKNGYCMLLGDSPAFEFTFTVPVVDRTTLRAVLELAVEGRPTAMLVPLVLLNGNLC
ncbi:MAG: ADP-ribosylglycohydrolase family protein [Kiritimatiellaeota bacterium]|nr:ADP-ribosylglycohydrolase family protein [Kiritimatiellota bacterium]